MINFLTQFSPILDFRSVLSIWSSAGLFDILLPFLLIFALVFAILEKSKILGGNRSISAIVALVIGFFGISNPYFSNFLPILFSNAALGFGIILALVLFIGLFMKGESNGMVWIGSLAGILIFFWVLSRTFQQSGFNSIFQHFFQGNPYLYSTLIYGGGLLAVIALVVLSNPDRQKSSDPIKAFDNFTKAFSGNK